MRISQDGKQLTLWADVDKAPRAHLENAFAQRRRQIVGDCYQLRIDVDHFNETLAGGQPIQLWLDLTDDVAELQARDGYEEDAA